MARPYSRNLSCPTVGELGRLKVSYVLNEQATVELTLTRKTNSLQRAKCPLDEKPVYEEVSSGQKSAGAGEGKSKLKVSSKDVIMTTVEHGPAKSTTYSRELKSALKRLATIPASTYELTAVAVNSASEKSKPVSIKFWVMEKPKRERGRRRS